MAKRQWRGIPGLPIVLAMVVGLFLVAAPALADENTTDGPVSVYPGLGGTGDDAVAIDVEEVEGGTAGHIGESNTYALSAASDEVEGEEQIIAADDVTVTYGDTGKCVSARVTFPEEGGGLISYAVTEGSEEYLEVDEKTGTLTIKSVPVDKVAYVTVSAAENDSYPRTMKDVKVTINPKVLTVKAMDQSITAGNAVPDLSQPALGRDYTVEGLVGSDALTTAPTLAYSSKPDNTKAGTYTITPSNADAGANYIIEYASGTLTISAKQPDPTPGALQLSGSGYVQGIGDKPAERSGDGIVIGTTGEAKRLEAITVSLPEGTDGGIEYRAHVQTVGWTGWVEGGKECGARDSGKRMEAVQMRLDLGLEKAYSVWYRVHCQTFGWLGWARDGQAAGTAGQAKRAEAVEVQVLPEGQVPGDYVKDQASYIGAAVADVHLQGTGWTGANSALEFGTTGQARRLEAIGLSVANQPEAGGVQYEVHVQNEGWMPAAADGAVAGTTGQARRLEAVKVSLTGELEKEFSVWYRVHSQTYGWLGWAVDGESAGTTGLAKRAEAIDVQILPKGQVPDGYDAGAPAAIIA